MHKGITMSIIREEAADKPKQEYSTEDAELGLLDFSKIKYVSAELAVDTVKEDGKLLMQGSVDHPMLVKLITSNADILHASGEETKPGMIRFTYTPFFISNTDMEIQVANYDDLADEPITEKFQIVGGQPQADFNEYNQLLNAKGEKFNTFQRHPEVDIPFIQSHPTSVVSLYLAGRLFENAYSLTKEQIDAIESSIQSCDLDTLRYSRYLEQIKYARQTAIGSPVADLDINDTEGNASTVVTELPKAKITLVDFWASWCGICRYKMPSIKEVYDSYSRDVFDIVGVSCDTHPENWYHAMETDQMPWKQYLLTKQGYTDFFKKYQTSGVPFYLVLDEHGNVISNDGSAENIRKIIEEHSK